jgi:hypothetical protein
MSGSELLARIARIRAELDECGRLIREIGDKAHARQLAGLIERANDVEREVKKEAQDDRRTNGL